MSWWVSQSEISIRAHEKGSECRVSELPHGAFMMELQCSRITSQVWQKWLLPISTSLKNSKAIFLERFLCLDKLEFCQFSYCTFTWRNVTPFPSYSGILDITPSLRMRPWISTEILSSAQTSIIHKISISEWVSENIKTSIKSHPK